jgi:hypothetical protein
MENSGSQCASVASLYISWKGGLDSHGHRHPIHWDFHRAALIAHRNGDLAILLIQVQKHSHEPPVIAPCGLHFPLHHGL